MPKYLDPKADITFKKIFGEHEDLVMSLLNALLPLPEGDEIVDVKYQNTETLPEKPTGKNTLVDVKCQDSKGRTFLVEMQMYWTESFFKRALFNTCKVYGMQIERGDQFNDIKPVYSLNILNDKMPHAGDDYRHVWKLTDVDNPRNTSNEISLTFIELPKFTPADKGHRKLMDLWLMFLTEVNEKMHELPEELAANGEILKAAEIVEVCAYTDAELNGYEKFWDGVRRERTGLYDERQRGRAEGRSETLLEVARKMKTQGMSDEVIASVTGLSLSEIVEMG